MVTIFATPKPFHGHIGLIQRNAIGSWMRIAPTPQIILFGDCEGARETAGEFGLEYVDGVEANEFGTPYLRAMIRSAEERAQHDLLIYVNGDIILTEGFESAIRFMSERKDFLMVAARMNLDLELPIDFGVNWREWLRLQCAERGKAGDHTGIDFFAFRRGFYRDIPPLAIGRAWFDQWMIKAALERGDVIDSSRLVPIIHQNHDYRHIAGGRESAYNGVEAQRNLALCGGKHSYTLLECSHELMPDGSLRRTWLRRRRFEARQVAWDIFVRRTVNVRSKLKLTRRSWQPKDKTTIGSAT
jgi:hypothetical protein